MNQPIFLNKLAFNLLLANLLEIEERRNEIIGDFFSEPSKEAEEIRKLLNEYINRLDGMLKDITVVETVGNDFPLVIIGSEVTVEDVANGKTYCYKLISPHKSKTDFNEISFLSPMGKALLLKKVNESFIVEAPGGNYEYKVLAVRIVKDARSSKFDLSYAEGEV